MVNVMKHNKTIELLAPAGSWEALEAAVNAGADAVYMGGKAFGARQYASNFDREELTRAVYFAHMHRVRLYITVNTLVDDAEMPELADYLLFADNGIITFHCPEQMDAFLADKLKRSHTHIRDLLSRNS